MRKLLFESLFRRPFTEPAPSPDDAALSELKQALRNTARQCAEIIERDRVPRQNRHGAAFVLALRPWKYSGFNQFERKQGA